MNLPETTGRATPLERYPALAAWQRQLRAGYCGQRADAPGTWVLDALWWAACWEARAHEFDREGESQAAERCLAQARQELAAGLRGAA